MAIQNSCLRLFVVAIVCCLVSQCQADQDWNQFLGPDSTSEAKDASPIAEWDAKNYVWETEIPGIGWSSPVYADDKIWLTTSEVQAATPEEIAKKRKGVQFAQMKTSASSVVLRALCVDLNTGKLLHLSLIHI